MPTNRYQSLGNVSLTTPCPNGLIFKIALCEVRVRFYTDSMVQVSTNVYGSFNTHSYAVVADMKPAEFSIESADDYVLMKSHHLMVKIELKPFRITYLNAYGNLLNEDEPGLSIGKMGSKLFNHKKLQPFERFIGLGEKCGHLDKYNRAFVNRNTDYFGYGTEADPIYASFPFYIGIHSGQQYGIFLDNSAESKFNFGASNNRFSSFSVEDGELNYFFIHHHKIRQIIESYVWLTGQAAMPPLWSLGLQQCRYSYYPEKKVESIARNYREKDIPCDVIYLDIHYMQDYKVFTWSRQNFPHHKKLLKDLQKDGFKVVTIMDPGIKTEPGYAVYDEGLKQDIFLKYPDGSNFTAMVWPGWCHFPDFTNPKGRTWWGSYFKTLKEDGVTGFWCDMNEPASWGQSLPEPVEFYNEGETASAIIGRNVYGMQMAAATYNGALAASPNERPFVLTRAGFSGSQRFGAIWIGDNTASDEHMLLGVRLVASLGITGMPFAGMDIGGFVGECSKELFIRWVSLGVFMPLFRIHTMIDNRETDPWSFGDTAEVICRNYIKLRYALLPYLYSEFRHSVQKGEPIVSTLAIDFPHEPRVYDYRFENEFLFGRQMLIAPCKSTDEFTEVFLPEAEKWYDFYNDTIFNANDVRVVKSPLHRLPVFVKAGAIIPMQKPGSYTEDLKEDMLNLHIYGGANGSYTYYEDDGSSFEFTEGKYFERTIEWDNASKRLKIGKVEGSYTSKFNYLKLVFHHCGEVKEVAVNGNIQPALFELQEMMQAVPQFDPLGHSENAEITEVYTSIVNNAKEEVVVNLL